MIDSVPALFAFVLLVSVPRLNVTSRAPLASVRLLVRLAAVMAPIDDVRPDVTTGANPGSMSTKAKPLSIVSTIRADGVTPSGIVSVIW